MKEVLALVRYTTYEEAQDMVRRGEAHIISPSSIVLGRGEESGEKVTLNPRRREIKVWKTLITR